MSTETMTHEDREKELAKLLKMANNGVHMVGNKKKEERPIWKRITEAAAATMATTLLVAYMATQILPTPMVQPYLYSKQQLEQVYNKDVSLLQARDETAQHKVLSEQLNEMLLESGANAYVVSKQHHTNSNVRKDYLTGNQISTNLGNVNAYVLNYVTINPNHVTQTIESSISVSKDLYDALCVAKGAPQTESSRYYGGEVTKQDCEIPEGVDLLNPAHFFGGPAKLKISYGSYISMHGKKELNNRDVDYRVASDFSPSQFTVLPQVKWDSNGQSTVTQEESMTDLSAEEGLGEAFEVAQLSVASIKTKRSLNDKFKTAMRDVHAPHFVGKKYDYR